VTHHSRSWKCILLDEVHLALQEYLLILYLGELIIDIPLEGVEPLGETLHALIQ
jgi:hypothetical protein